MKEILIDMEDLLATDSRFLLGNWLENAKSKATNQFEINLFEWNARNQITLWGTNSSEIVIISIENCSCKKKTIAILIGF